MEVCVSYKYNMSAPAAVTAVRASFRNKFLPTKMNRAFTALAGAQIYYCKIDKHNSFKLLFNQG